MSTSPLMPGDSPEHKPTEPETQELALKPLIYILVLPMLLLGLLQWSGLPAYLVSLVTGH